MRKQNWRNTSQYLLEGKKDNSQTEGYDIYPALKIEDGQILIGYDLLAEELKDQKYVVVDAYIGVFISDFQYELDRALKKLGIQALWWHTSAALKSPEEIRQLIAPFLGGDDPVFGKLAKPLDMSDFFNLASLNSIQPDPEAQLNILIGYGASLGNWKGKLLYIDLPKNELQFRARANSITNFGADRCEDGKQMYKRFYFVDWVVFNKRKKEIISEIDIMVDGQNPDAPTWMKGLALRNSMHHLAHNVLRVRPWFEPGVWGGTWIKDHIKGLNKNVPNYAWSFELIVPENGLLIESGNTLLEVSYDTLMFLENDAVLGDHAETYPYEFPIRFDFLDTFDGGNLSVQCHPRLEYMKEHFGESITQEETYYILDCKKDALVYLGFQKDIDPDKFRVDLEWSADNGEEINIHEHVQSLGANKHDLFLIPPGTIHGSGKNNLVLEISATPYIFTFKMYDWARLDLDGKPRPINIDHAMKNLYFDRCGERIAEEFVSKPYKLAAGDDWELFHMPTHKDHLYDVHRYHFRTQITIDTENRFHVLSLVEGSSIMLVTNSGHRQRFKYAETFVVPAAAGSYSVTNEGVGEAMIVKAFCK